MTARHLRGATSAVCILIALAAGPVSATAPSEAGVHKGEPVALGRGAAYAWVAIGADGRPEALGVSMSAEALQGLEALPQADLTLMFPAEAAGTGFEHVFLNWNPHGHPPADIWGEPHFDIHFYMIPPSEREAISWDDPDFSTKAERHPPARFLAADYVTDGKAVPGMGVHWADALTPEFHGEPFTHTVLYGGWDSRITFVEPMVTKAVFDKQTTLVAPIRQPEAVAGPVLLPTQYRIDFDAEAQEHRVILEALVARR